MQIAATRIATIGSFIIAYSWCYFSFDWEPINALFATTCILIGTEYSLYKERRKNSLQIFPESANIQSEMEKYIEACQYEIKLIGIHFEKSFSDHRGKYENALKRGVSIEVYCLNPESPELEGHSKALDIEPEELKYECLTFMKQAQALARFASSRAVRGSFNLYDRIRPYSFRGYCFDLQHDSGMVIIVPLLDGIRSSASPALKLNAKSKNVDSILRSISSIERSRRQPKISSI